MTIVLNVTLLFVLFYGMLSYATAKEWHENFSSVLIILAALASLVALQTLNV